MVKLLLLLVAVVFSFAESITQALWVQLEALDTMDQLKCAIDHILDKILAALTRGVLWMMGHNFRRRNLPNFLLPGILNYELLLLFFQELTWLLQITRSELFQLYSFATTSTVIRKLNLRDRGPSRRMHWPQFLRMPPLNPGLALTRCLVWGEITAIRLKLELLLVEIRIVLCSLYLPIMLLI